MPQSPNDERPEWPYKGLLVLAGVFVLMVVIGGGLSIYFIGEEWDTRGQFGDMFGAVNALFSGLAFAILIYTMLLQKKELEYQRQELRDNREEFHRMANANEQQLKVMHSSGQSEISSKQPYFTLSGHNPNKIELRNENNPAFDLKFMLLDEDGVKEIYMNPHDLFNPSMSASVSYPAGRKGSTGYKFKLMYRDLLGLSQEQVFFLDNTTVPHFRRLYEDSEEMD
jgi:hypothetical protein